jgi:light-regulated signal transduction histidine kinase (bacteriophytochrome)
LQLRYTWFYNPKLGYGAEEVIGKTDAQLMDTACAQEIERLKRRVIETGLSTRQVVGTAAPGAPLEYFDLSIEPLLNLAGQIVGVTCSAADVSEQRQVSQALSTANQELARSNADLEQFAYAASHDLQEPLRSVSSCVQLLKKRYAGHIDARADEFIEHAVSGATRMQQLINDLLLYAKLNDRSQDKVPVQLNDALNLALANLSSAIAQSHADITFDNLPDVLAYKGQMPQLFQNLVGNALKFRADRTPVIHIGVSQTPQEWVIAVKDNGIGIDQRHVERVFKLFQRLHGREEFSGTGIGLALCQRIVERHGGRIWLESEPGQGSTFYFSLPRLN